MDLDKLFVFLLNNSITAGWVILAVVALRFVLKRAPRRIVFLLWILPALRLAFPFSLPSPLSLVPSVNTVPQEILTAPVPSVGSNIPLVDNAINPVLETSFTAPVGASVNPMQIAMYLAGLVYLAGLALILACSLIKTLRLRRRLREAILLRDNIWQSDCAETPFVMGVFRPRIYLPFSINSDSMDYVLAHECAHITRRDNLSKLTGFLILSVYWFNPLVWLAYVLFCRDIELACDERVISNYDASSRKAYSLALLGCSVRSRSVLFCPVAFGELGVKARIKNVLNFKKPAVWVTAAVLLVCAAAAVCLLTVPEETSPAVPASSSALKSAAPPSLEPVLSAECSHHADVTSPIFSNNAAQVVSDYANHVHRDAILAYPDDSSYHVEDYKVLNHRLVSIAPNAGKVAGEVTFAITGCSDESVWLAEGAVRGDGEWGGWLVKTRQFVFIRDIHDNWYLAAYGDGDFSYDTQFFALPLDFVPYSTVNEKLLTANARTELQSWYELGILAAPLLLDGENTVVYSNPPREADGGRVLPAHYEIRNYWSPSGYSVDLMLDADTNKLFYLNICKTPGADDVPVNNKPVDWDGKEFYLYNTLGDILPEDMTLDELCKLLASYWGYSSYRFGKSYYEPAPSSSQAELTYTPTGSELVNSLTDIDYVRVYFEGDESGCPIFIDVSLMLAYSSVLIGPYYMKG